MPWHGLGVGCLPLFIIWFFWASIVAIAVILVIRLIVTLTRSAPRGAKNEAEEVLKQRYARGELTGEQYDEMLDRIRH